MLWNVDYRTARSSPARPAGSELPELFSGAHSGTVFYKLFTAFPENAKNGVGPAGSTLFFAFPGDAAKRLQTKVPEWDQKKIRNLGGLVGGFGPSFGPDLIFKSGQKHQKWPEMSPELTVWVENWSRSIIARTAPERLGWV